MSFLIIDYVSHLSKNYLSFMNVTVKNKRINFIIKTKTTKSMKYGTFLTLSTEIVF